MQDNYIEANSSIQIKKVVVKLKTVAQLMHSFAFQKGRANMYYLQIRGKILNVPKWNSFQVKNNSAQRLPIRVTWGTSPEFLARGFSWLLCEWLLLIAWPLHCRHMESFSLPHPPILVNIVLVSIPLIVSVWQCLLVVATHRAAMDTSFIPDNHFPKPSTLRHQLPSSFIVDEFKVMVLKFKK